MQHKLIYHNICNTCSLSNYDHNTFNNNFQLEDRSQKKKDNVFARPEKDIKVSAKVLRNASFLALYCCGNQSQRSLLYLARFSRYKHFCVLQKIKKLKMSAIFGETKIF